MAHGDEMNAKVAELAERLDSSTQELQQQIHTLESEKSSLVQEVDQLMDYVTELNQEKRTLQASIADQDFEKDARLVSWNCLQRGRGVAKSTSIILLSVSFLSFFSFLPRRLCFCF